MEQVSKTEFKAHALEIFRDIEKSGLSKIITDHGKPTLEIRKLRQKLLSPLEVLKSTVIKYEAATLPLADDHWHNS